MCGVFGFVSADEKTTPDMDHLARIARVTETRGKHAWGMSWIDGAGVLRSFKKTGRITDNLALLKMAADARMLIGHCRYATEGSYDNNVNNHPHPCDGGWIVHNGMIPTWETLVEEHGLHLNSECDSEVLALLMEKFSGSLMERMTAAIDCVRYGQPLVMLGLWKPGRLLAARRGNPLSIGETKRGTYLASLPEGLPGKVSAVPNNRIMEFGPCE
jgi:glucosamine 6-phosphate synthetase-like amidotransferase/phosphosugar isomerase protein